MPGHAQSPPRSANETLSPSPVTRGSSTRPSPVARACSRPPVMARSRLASAASVQAAEQDEKSVLGGPLSERRHDRSLQRLRRLELPRPSRDAGEHLRVGEQLGSAFQRFVEEGECALEVRRHVAGGGHLRQRDAAHASLPAPLRNGPDPAAPAMPSGVTRWIPEARASRPLEPSAGQSPASQASHPQECSAVAPGKRASRPSPSERSTIPPCGRDARVPGRSDPTALVPLMPRRPEA